MDTLVNKMKIESLARDTVDESLGPSLKNLEQLKNEGNLQGLRNAWANIRALPESGDSREISEPFRNWTDETNSKPGDRNHQTYVERVNLALPPSMFFDGHPDSIMTASFTLPDHEHRELYVSLEETKLGDPPKSMKKPEQGGDQKLAPMFPRLAHQTLRDCGRDHFCLREPNKADIYFETGADAFEVARAIENFGSASPGQYLETGSRLINQEALAGLFVPFMERITTRSGLGFRTEKQDQVEPDIDVKPDPLLRSEESKVKSRKPKYSETEYTWTKLTDGGAEFSIRQRQKAHFLWDDQGNQIEINRGPRWEGDINDNNFGLEITTKIRVSAGAMETGNLKNVVIVDPLRIKYQIAPALQ